MVRKVVGVPSGLKTADSVYLCGLERCCIPVTDLSGGMQCDLCGRWFHEACTGLPADQYALLASNERFLYSCEDCFKLKAERFVTTKDCFDSLVSRLTNMERVFSLLLTTLDGKVEGLLDRLTPSVVHAQVKLADSNTQTDSVDLTPYPATDCELVGAEQLERTLPAKRKPSKKKKTVNLQNAVVSECTVDQVSTSLAEPSVLSPSVSPPKDSSYAASASKQPATQSHDSMTVARGVGTPRRSDSYTDSSVIFRNVTESTAALPKERMLADLQWFKICISKLLPPGFPGVTVRKLIRLGSVPVDASGVKPRLLRVVLSTPDERNTLLRFAFKLKGSGVSMQPDLPLTDRLKLKAAIKDLKARREAGETGLRLVGFRVVSRRSTSALSEPVLVAPDPRLTIPICLK
ncbi:unnamed protein product [Dicrocoelium dendriticum]|nr:unnamed protein product [Dicrocoelium dendriticum]CAI2738579.1 unnamed protein product [Dicrocoelium dendriticum]